MNVSSENFTHGNGTAIYIPADVILLETILYRTLLPITCVGGIIGIIMTVIVLSRKNMCTSTNCYLKALAITDLIFLTLFSTKLLDNHFAEKGPIAFEKFHIYLAYLEIFLHLFNMASIWLTVMLSIERYIAICYPLRAVSLSTVSGARKFIVTIYFVAFLCGLPKFWEFKVARIPQFPTPFIKLTELSYNTEYIMAYRIVYEILLSAVIPFLFLIVINSRLIQEIHRSTRYLRHHLAADSIVSHVISAEELQLTLMLVGITAVFFLCHAPYVVYNFIAVLTKYIYSRSPAMGFTRAFRTFLHVSLLLLSVKSAVNFILYCWFSEKFRVTFKRLFCMPNCLTRPQMRRLSNNSHNHNRRNSYHISRETTC